MIAQTRGAVNAGRRARGRPGNRKPRVLAAFVGADSISARGPCRAANTRGRDKSRPYGRRRVCSQPGKPWPRVITNLCRGRCLHRPGGPRRAANARGRIWNPPLQWVPRIGNMRCFRLARNTQNDCRAGCPHPAGPAARRSENRPPRCALPVSPPISSPACHLSRRAV